MSEIPVHWEAVLDVLVCLEYMQSFACQMCMTTPILVTIVGTCRLLYCTVRQSHTHTHVGKSRSMLRQNVSNTHWLTSSGSVSPLQSRSVGKHTHTHTHTHTFTLIQSLNWKTRPNHRGKTIKPKIIGQVQWGRCHLSH